MGHHLRLGLLCGIAFAALAVTTASSTSTLRPLRYIALGDSFSAGEGVPPFRPGTNRLLPPRDTCHRSYRAYPALIAGRRSSPGIWGFWACSGARVQDMSNVNHEDPGEVAQLDRVALKGRPDPSVDLITLTIGGNDAQFNPAVLDCVASHAVPALGNCQANYRALVAVAINRLRSTLPPVFRELRARAPRARIIVLGYPNPFPTVLPTLSRCRLWFAQSDLLWLSQAAASLNSAIRAATIASGANVTYLAPSGFSRHDVCAQEPWFNGLDLLPPTHLRYSFHPNVLGQRQLAKNVLAVL